MNCPRDLRSVPLSDSPPNAFLRAVIPEIRQGNIRGAEMHYGGIPQKWEDQSVSASPL